MSKLLLIILTFVLSLSTGFSHSGGLDKDGGHHDRKNGGYHKHRIIEADDLIQYHGGGLDKSGGHTDRKTGKYHKHR